MDIKGLLRLQLVYNGPYIETSHLIRAIEFESKQSTVQTETRYHYTTEVDSEIFIIFCKT